MKKLYALIILVSGFYISNAQILQLWGTTSQGGGPDDLGTLFKINMDGNGFNTVHHCDTITGYGPFGSLVQAGNGSLYGMMEDGGDSMNSSGVIFQYDPITSSYTNVYNFDYYFNGGYPDGSLIAANNGLLYGMTTGGGINGYGTLFSFDPNSNIFTHLYDFSNASAAWPYGSLLQAADSNLYGLTSDLAIDTTGTLFRYKISDSSFTVLHKFTNATGVDPEGTLIQLNDGSLCGLTSGGGLYGFGVIFKYNLNSNNYADVYNFNDTLGSNPLSGLSPFIDGLYYGMTSSGGDNSEGTIFSFDAVNNIYADVYSFNGQNGATPFGDVLDGGNGKLYGMTTFGGADSGGVLFSFDPSAPAYTDLVDFNGANGRFPFGSLIQIMSTGIQEHTLAETIQLFPNPSDMEFRITNSGSPIQNVAIYNAIGEKVFSRSLGSENKTNQITIDVSTLSAGVYFVHVNNAVSNWVGKMVKE